MVLHAWLYAMPDALSDGYDLLCTRPRPSRALACSMMNLEDAMMVDPVWEVTRPGNKKDVVGSLAAMVQGGGVECVAGS